MDNNLFFESECKIKEKLEELSFLNKKRFKVFKNKMKDESLNEINEITIPINSNNLKNNNSKYFCNKVKTKKNKIVYTYNFSGKSSPKITKKKIQN